MKKIKIGLVGSSGRMGREIFKVIADNSRCELFYAIDREDKFDIARGMKVDVWIDFSTPEALKDVLGFALKTKKPLVCGTTGLSQSEKKSIELAAKKIPLLWSSNMSLGVAVLNEAIKSLSAVSHFDFQVMEIHHNKKKDKPSGTAITLQENLLGIIKKEIAEPVSIRGGGVFGVHKLYAMSDEEIITFEHEALNRTVFARGAVHAAEWLVKQKKPGFYKMSDVLFSKRPK